MRAFSRVVFPLLILANLVACNTVSPEQTAVPTQPLPTATATPSAQGACANPLYPVVKGATWSYAGTGGPAGAYRFTDTITEVRADGFTLSTAFNNSLTRGLEWSCKPEGLVALQLPGAAGNLTADQLQAQIETSNVQGITIPVIVSAGAQWPYSLSIKGRLNAGGTTAEATGDAKFAFHAIGMESVTVPAGTFEAMKIDTVVTLDFTAAISGLSIPVKVILNSTVWYAPGVGMVKTLTSGDLAGTAFNDTLELQSYNIP